MGRGVRRWPTVGEIGRLRLRERHFAGHSPHRFATSSDGQRPVMPESSASFSCSRRDALIGRGHGRLPGSEERIGRDYADTRTISIIHQPYWPRITRINAAISNQTLIGAINADERGYSPLLSASLVSRFHPSIGAYPLRFAFNLFGCPRSSAWPGRFSLCPLRRSDNAGASFA